jgi:hypothetical protein
MNIHPIFNQAAKLAALDAPMSFRSSAAYQARLANWQQHSGVRNGRPRPTHDGIGTLPFTLGLVPLARHRLVCDRGDTVRNVVLAQHLYRFCNFTEHLELEAVVPACVRLRLANVQFGVPEALARDAGRVAIDETWHAECAGDLKLDLMQTTAVVPCRSRTPMFLQVLKIIKASLTPDRQHLADMLFTCVSETLITGALTTVPRDEQVLPKVRDVLGEHAREEAFHHAIFAQVIGVMWEQLSAADRDVAGPLFALFIAAFLQPDTLAELDGLEAAGFTADEARRIVEETRESGAAESRRLLWKAASPTVRCMANHGLLDHAATRENLEMMDLLRPGAEPPGGTAQAT